jgi:hypothetical protein
MSDDEEPYFDLFPAYDGSTSPHAVVAAALVGQVIVMALSVGLLFWTSPWLAFGTTALASVYLYHLAWERVLTHSGLVWRICTAVAMMCVMLFAAAFLYLASL